MSRKTFCTGAPEAEGTPAAEVLFFAFVPRPSSSGIDFREIRSSSFKSQHKSGSSCAQTPSCGRLVATLGKMLMSPANTRMWESQKKASEKRPALAKGSIAHILQQQPKSLRSNSTPRQLKISQAACRLPA